MRVQSHTQRAAGSAWWSALEIIAGYGVQLVVMVILARLLTRVCFRLIATLLAFTSVAALFVDSGLGTAPVQHQPTIDNDESAVFLLIIGASVLVAAILWLIAPVIANFYAQPPLTMLIRVMAFIPPLGALAAVPDALLTQRLNFKARAKGEIIASLYSGTIALVTAWRSLGVWSLT